LRAHIEIEIDTLKNEYKWKEIMDSKELKNVETNA